MSTKLTFIFPNIHYFGGTKKYFSTLRIHLLPCPDRTELCSSGCAPGQPPLIACHPGAGLIRLSSVSVSPVSDTRGTRPLASGTVPPPLSCVRVQSGCPAGVHQQPSSAGARQPVFEKRLSGFVKFTLCVEFSSVNMRRRFLLNSHSASSFQV